MTNPEMPTTKRQIAASVIVLIRKLRIRSLCSSRVWGDKVIAFGDDWISGKRERYGVVDCIGLGDNALVVTVVGGLISWADIIQKINKTKNANIKNKYTILFT